MCYPKLKSLRVTFEGSRLLSKGEPWWMFQIYDQPYLSSYFKPKDRIFVLAFFSLVLLVKNAMKKFAF